MPLSALSLSHFLLCSVPQFLFPIRAAFDPSQMVYSGLGFRKLEALRNAKCRSTQMTAM